MTILHSSKGDADQQATLYYTFSALQGYRPAEMAMGYRHWAGIGVKEVSCSKQIHLEHRELTFRNACSPWIGMKLQLKEVSGCISLNHHQAS